MESIQAIVLHGVQHKDSTKIIKVLSEKDEVIPLYITGFGKGKTSKKSAAYYPGNKIEITVVNNSGLRKVRSESILDAHTGIQGNIVKSSILTVTLECIYKFLPQEQRFDGVFDFYQHYLTYLSDASEILNMPLLFLIRLSHFLGIQPEPGEGCFNLREGCFEYDKHTMYGIDLELSTKLSKCLSGSSREVLSLSFSNRERKELLDAYIRFIDYHIDGRHPILSLDVLSVVLSD